MAHRPMVSHPAMRPMFARTHWGHQRRALRRGITAAMLYAGGSELTHGTMRTMAEVHSRRGRAPVDPELYQFWIESLITTVAECDPRYAPELEPRWRQALQPMIDAFIEAY
ncbi:globin [Sediminicurvatus halobius]|nr:globin [Spiribacter halobius]UEX76487.1 globin [Spiribacter halobius]